MPTIRYFAAAAEAAGTATETRDAATLGELFDALIAEHGETFGRILGRCSVLVDGRAGGSPATDVSSAITVDILPPFAGG